MGLRIAEAIDERRPGMVPRGGGWYVTSGTMECEGAKFHSPHPLVLRDVPPWPGLRVTDESQCFVLCGTCADNLGVLQELYEAYDGDVPWPVRREFGNQIQALAKAGWEARSEAMSRG